MNGNKKQFYDDVICENNRSIEPSSQLLSLADKVFEMISSNMEYRRKDKNRYFDCLAFKLNHLYCAYRSGCNLAYSRDSKFYLKKYCADENRHFWEYSIISEVTDALETGLYIRQIKGNNLIGYRTIAVIRPFLSEELRKIVPYKVKLSDNLNPIELRKREKIIGTYGHIEYRKVPISYKDDQDERIPKIRQELGEIYTFYKNQDLAGFIPAPILTKNPEYIKILSQYNNTGRIDLESQQEGVHFKIIDRWVKRIFNNSTFENGGRLYASWQNLPRELRKYLLINGSRVAELDYSGCQVRMIYHMWLNKPCLDEDVYQIAGLRREIAKKAAVICINAETQREALGALRAYCIDELNMKDVSYSDARRMMQAFMIKHRPIAEYFNSGAGVVMMRIESEIIVRIIRELMNLNIPVLTIHDSCIYPVQHQKKVRDAMMDEYHKVLKFYPTVKIEY